MQEVIEEEKGKMQLGEIYLQELKPHLNKKGS